MREITARVAVLGLLTVLVGCDHATKLVAKAELQGQGSHELIRGVMDLRYTENRDVAFNLLRWIPENIRLPALIVGGAVALFALAAALLQRRLQNPVARTALLFVTAGALGNYLDRIGRGYVVDFVHVHHWPVFNVADAYVTVGMAMLALAAFRTRPSRSEA